MNIAQLLRKNRSFRRFHEEQPIARQTLIELVELTRLCPSSSNRQPLKYLVACEPDERAKVFPHLQWAGALRDWPGPAEGERPTAYIVILGDTRIASTFSVDPGIVAQSMLLAAAERGLGGCMFGSVDRRGICRDLNIPEHLQVVLVVALGRPAETVVLEEMKDPTTIDYWRDDAHVHHVPKRPLEEILVQFCK